MAKLTSKSRNLLDRSQFALPGEKKYPIPDKAHAVKAKARATQQEAAGKLAPSAAAKIRAKANKMLSAGGTKKGLDKMPKGC